MKRVGAFDAKTHLSQLLNEVERTQREIIIQRRGRDVAVLGPCQDLLASQDEDRKERVIAGFREVRARQRRARSRERAKHLIVEGRKR